MRKDHRRSSLDQEVERKVVGDPLDADPAPLVAGSDGHVSLMAAAPPAAICRRAAPRQHDVFCSIASMVAFTAAIAIELNVVL